MNLDLEYKFEIEMLESTFKAFSKAMIDKLISKAEQGFYGWDNEESISDIDIRVSLFNHIRRALVENEGGQWIDIANFAMFLWTRGNLKHANRCEGKTEG